MQDFKEASAEIKVKTKRFSLKKGTIKICFELPEEKGQIRSLKLKLRNEIMDAQNSSQMHTTHEIQRKQNCLSGGDQCKCLSYGAGILGCCGCC